MKNCFVLKFGIYLENFLLIFGMILYELLAIAINKKMYKWNEKIESYHLYPLGKILVPTKYFI